MAIRLGSTVINCADLDLYTDDQAAEVERLTRLGARTVRHDREPGDDCVVMTDPEGNEFCVCAVPAPDPPNPAEPDQACAKRLVSV